MTEVAYEFIGYTKEEMDAFMSSLSRHLMRGGG
jgi:hypothetical protein